jgi:hypothetical protein
MNNEDIKAEPLQQESANETNETGGFCFSSFIKISDPDSKEVIVQMRGD